MIEQLIALQESIYQIAKDHGFWDQGKERNRGETVMLMITELSEAVEIHRKGKNKDAAYWLQVAELLSVEPYFQKNYELVVKNTVEEEMADVTIRLLDYCYGFGYRVEPIYCSDTSLGNFAEDVLRLNWYIHCAYHFTAFDDDDYADTDWGMVLSAILAFCQWYNIDLLQHTQWKLQYNRTRAYKHGKSY